LSVVEKKTLIVYPWARTSHIEANNWLSCVRIIRCQCISNHAPSWTRQYCPWTTESANSQTFKLTL